MQSKYVVGDVVKIIHTDNTTELFSNKVGVVKTILDQQEPNIGVNFGDEWSVFFYTIELEKVNSK
jgi:hypothetical protein